MPAVAVIRRAQALSEFTGRKGSRRRSTASYLKWRGLTSSGGKRWADLRFGGVSGTSGVAVKCVDIGRNTESEGRKPINT